MEEGIKEENKEQTNKNEDKPETPKVENDWMIRKCFIYDEEYSDCTSLKARFNQYFIFGKSIDCSQWKRDSINCYKWENDKDVNAANELVKSEKQKRKERLLPHYKNDVWTKRTSPPENWNCPLPDYITKEYENSYLNIKSKEMKGEIPPSFDMDFKCSIM
ncbi:UPF0545 protein C22orf39 homolog [Diabrotica virgifera virgifera]|uniref:Synaptic plasticity regulator PANTS n=1 Tax=Diabrotica virgifera virgifera TaxID=50390 RepID=A0A6P7F885_DIAVI|nr:UPF0545 protein C22orf39 homolog [Diabrotica virgifera virgifera]